MRPLIAAVIATAVIVAGTPVSRAHQQPAPATSQQVFRAAADVVTVDVSVRTNGARVGGLSAKDFVVLDNGVPQHIDTVESSVVPVDVTILVDTDAEVADVTDDVNKQARRIASMLRPIDRLRVWNIDTAVTEVVPLAAAGPHPTLPPMGEGGLAPVNDAIAAALMEPVAPDARHLVIAVTNGIDTDSVLSLDTVKAIAAKSNATLHVSQIDVVETPGGNWVTSAEDLRGYQCGVVHICEPRRKFWQPHYTPTGADRFGPLTAIAQSTGGEVHTLGLFVEHNAADVFQNAFKDFQTNYILRYTPTGVAREGWHSLAVTIPAYSDYQIRARRGYSIEDGGALTPASGAPDRAPAVVVNASASADRARPVSEVDRVMQAYGRADYETAFSVARQISDQAALIRAARGAGDIWPTSPHREAVFALELAQVVISSQSPAVRSAVTDWLTQEAKLVEPLLDISQSAFEHDWLATELDLLQAPVNPTIAQPFVAAALDRFPGDPGFLLASAIVADQRWPLGTRAVMTSAAADRQVADVVAKYDAVIAHADARGVAAEARVRQAWLLHRANRDAQALAQLDSVREADADPAFKFLRQLFRGHVLLALGRTTDAVDAYRAAVTILPRAESARVALMNALLVAGDREGALALSENIQAVPPAGADPWHLYWQGDYRRFPDAIARLREQAR